jgi:hypothetical protein
MDRSNEYPLSINNLPQVRGYPSSSYPAYFGEVCGFSPASELGTMVLVAPKPKITMGAPIFMSTSSVCGIVMGDDADITERHEQLADDKGLPRAMYHENALAIYNFDRRRIRNLQLQVAAWFGVEPSAAGPSSSRGLGAPQGRPAR